MGKKPEDGNLQGLATQSPDDVLLFIDIDNIASEC